MKGAESDWSAAAGRGTWKPSAEWLCLAGLLSIVALGIRLLALDQSLWIDEAGSIAQASAADFLATARHDVHPPLYFAILRLGLRLTGSFAVLRLFSVGCGLGVLLVAIRSFRESRAAMLVAGGVAAALPELVVHSKELRPYALLYFLLTAALALAARAYFHPAEKIPRRCLAVVLAISAATHLVTAFFLIALVPLMYWPVRGKGVRSAMACLLPLVPAGVILLWLRYRFVTTPESLAEGWWLPPTDVRGLWESFLELIGWRELGWLAEAVRRRVAMAGTLLPYFAAGALALAAWSAWGHRKGGTLKAALLASAGVYFAAIFAYSHFIEAIILPRTLLPGLLPLVGALALGIGSDPVKRRRAIGVAAVLAYLLLVISPTVRRSLTPMAGLRGLAGAINHERRASDLVVLLRPLDFGLAPYGVSVRQAQVLYIDQTRKDPGQFAELSRQIGQLGASGRVLIGFREDYYLQHHRDVLAALVAELVACGRTSRVLWQENDLGLLIAEPATNGRRPAG